MRICALLRHLMGRMRICAYGEEGFVCKHACSYVPMDKKLCMQTRLRISAGVPF